MSCYLHHLLEHFFPHWSQTYGFGRREHSTLWRRHWCRFRLLVLAKSQPHISQQHLEPGIGMSVIKSNMAAIEVYYKKIDAWWHQNFMIAIHVFVFKMHTFKIFQKLNHRNIFECLKDNKPLELPFFHTNTYKLMSSQGNLFQKQARSPLIFMFQFYFLSL